MFNIRIVLVLALLSYCQPALLAQIAYKGKIVDKETQQPVQGASVFFSNTSYGTISAADGSFSLVVPAATRYDMVIAMVGYETVVQNLGVADAANFLSVALKPVVKELEAVVLQAYEKDGWNKWGRFFLNNFIGTSPYAADCEIVNYKDIKFRHNKTDNELTAVCHKPLIIENKALGYTIRYQLEQFTSSFSQHYMVFTGYPLFEEMTGSERKMRIWKERREEVFKGSVMHFMRSLYRNHLQQDNFLVYRLKIVPNEEKARVKKLYRQAMRVTDSTSHLQKPKQITLGGGAMVTYSKGVLSNKVLNPYEASDDSLAYYNKVMQQANAFEILNKTPLTGDSIAYAIDSVTVGLEFSDHLVVVYTGKKEPAAYRQQSGAQGGPEASISSRITLMNNEPLEISSNGSYFNPVNMIASEYWGWAEKIAFMLPVNYKSVSR